FDPWFPWVAGVDTMTTRERANPITERPADPRVENELERIFALVRVARRRLFLSALCRNLAVDGILVAAAVLVLVLVDRAFALDLPMPIAVVSCIGIGVLVSLARSYVWGRPGTLEAAAEADRRLDLSERLSTALYLGAGKDEAILAEWRELVIRDGGR